MLSLTTSFVPQSSSLCIVGTSHLSFGISDGMAMSVRKAFFFVKSTQIMSGLLWGKCLSVCTVKSHKSFILSFYITDCGQWSQYLLVHSIS